jgi:hypothetical protein
MSGLFDPDRASRVAAGVPERTLLDEILAQLVQPPADEAEALRREVQRLRTELDELRRTVEDLVGERPGITVRDPWGAWISAHPEEMAKHRGKRIAVHPTMGIVAADDTLEAVYEAVVRQGLLDEVAFDVSR